DGDLVANLQRIGHRPRGATFRFWRQGEALLDEIGRRVEDRAFAGFVGTRGVDYLENLDEFADVFLAIVAPMQGTHAAGFPVAMLGQLRAIFGELVGSADLTRLAQVVGLHALDPDALFGEGLRAAASVEPDRLAHGVHAAGAL